VWCHCRSELPVEWWDELCRMTRRQCARVYLIRILGAKILDVSGRHAISRVEDNVLFYEGRVRSNHLTTLIRSWYRLFQIRAERGPKRTGPCVKWRLTPEIGMLEILLNDVN
jgi:hypothetical protein